MMKIFISILLLLIIHQSLYSQVPDSLIVPYPDTANVPVVESLPVFQDTVQYNDTSIQKTSSGKDTTIVTKKVHSPRQATIRSAILPGWGQVYNKKYWKVPIVYAAIGIPAYTFFDNKAWYNKTRYALSVVANNQTDDPESMSKVDPQLRALVEGKYESSLVNYRNQFRRDMDLSILITLLMWGLNIVDATVDGHLIGFDVSDELSMKIRPAAIPGSLTPGIALVVNFKK